MRVIKGLDGCKETWQNDFSATSGCSCGKTAKIAFTAIEESGEADGYICQSRPKDAKLWPHDAIAVAVYICPGCMKTHSRMNQG